jgi:hypothetical protein
MVSCVARHLFFSTTQPMRAVSCPLWTDSQTHRDRRCNCKLDCDVLASLALHRSAAERLPRR